MPRNEDMVYSLPAGTEAVTGTTIESAKYNMVLRDLETEMNAARPIAAGGTGTTSLAGLQALVGYYSVDSIATLTASSTDYPIGTILVTKSGQFSFQVVSSDPDLTTAGGVGLRAIGNEYRPAAFGLVGDGTDSVAAVKRLLTRASAARVPIIWDGGEYAFDEWEDPTPSPFIDWRAIRPTTLRSTKAAPNAADYEADHFIRIGAATVAITAASASVFENGSRMSIPDTAGMKPGDLLILASSRTIETDHRGQARHGVCIPVLRVVDGTTVEFERPFPSTMHVGNLTATVTSKPSATSLVVSGLSGRTPGEVRYGMRVTSGAANGSTARIVGFDPATNTITSHASNSVFPAAIAVGDTIEIVREISVTRVEKSHVRITGPLTLDRAPHLDAVAPAYGFRGMFINRCVRPVIDGLVTRNFSETGLRLAWCYEATVSNVDHHGCNRSYDGSDGTGYGLAVHQSSWGTFETIRGFGCRRTLDMGGTQGVSYYNVTKGVEGYGSGTTYTGARFWPAGEIQNSVVGSHGAAVGNRYIDSVGVAMHGILNCRGDREIARGVYGAGMMDRMINAFTGDGLDVDGVYYRAPGFDWAIPRASRVQPSPQDYLRSVARVAAYSILPGRAHSIRGMDIQGCREAVLVVEPTGSIGPITLSGTVFMENETGPADTFIAVDKQGTGSVTLTGPVDLRDLQLRNNPASLIATPRHVEMSEWVWGPEAFILLPGGQAVTQIENNAIARLPVTSNQGAAMVNIIAFTRDRTWCLLNAMIWQGRTGDKSPVTNSSGIDVSDQLLTGTTGTAGRITVSLNPSAGLRSALYVENRTGSAQFFQVKCDAFL